MWTLATIFITVSHTFALPPGLLSALCYVESSHNPRAVNLDDKGGPSRGVCQIQEATARLMGFKGTTAQLMEPRVNAYYAGKYLHWELKRYKGDTVKGVAAYNSGSFLLGQDGLPVNKVYVTKVFRAWKERR